MIRNHRELKPSDMDVLLAGRFKKIRDDINAENNRIAQAKKTGVIKEKELVKTFNNLGWGVNENNTRIVKDFEILNQEVSKEVFAKLLNKLIDDVYQLGWDVLDKRILASTIKQDSFKRMFSDNPKHLKRYFTIRIYPYSEHGPFDGDYTDEQKMNDLYNFDLNQFVSKLNKFDEEIQNLFDELEEDSGIIINDITNINKIKNHMWVAPWNANI